MCAAIALGNIIGVAVYIFLKPIVPLECDLNTGAIITLSTKMHNLVNSGFIGIKELNKGSQATFIGINLLLTIALVS